MTHFLVVYDLSAGRVVSLEAFSDAERGQALEKRFALERIHADDPNLEVIVLSAASLDALKATHGRYFKDVQELASGSV